MRRNTLVFLVNDYDYRFRSHIAFLLRHNRFDVDSIFNSEAVLPQPNTAITPPNTGALPQSNTSPATNR